MDLQIRIDGGTVDDYIALTGYLNGSRDFRGRVRQVTGPPEDGKLDAGVIEMLTVAVGSGGLGVALSASLNKWLENRRPDVTAEVTVTPQRRITTVTIRRAVVKPRTNDLQLRGWRPGRLGRVQLGGIRRELEDRQPVLGRDQRAHRLDRRAVPLDRGTAPSCVSIVRVLNPSYYAPYGMLASCSMYWTRRIHRNPWKVTVPSWKVSCPRRMNREIPDSGFGLPRRTRPGPRR